MNRQETDDRHRIRREKLKTERLLCRWKLNRVDDVAWIQDSSGIYVYIEWDVKTDSTRLDLMTESNAEPLQSFIGESDNVRKAVMQWLAARISHKAGLGISIEHAAYIGSELERCDAERIDYVQD